MDENLIKAIRLFDSHLWEKISNKRSVVYFDLEITARCNNNCRHCYINLPKDDNKAKEKELTFAEIKKIADEAVDLGALGCLITGGEPLLREDFFDIYLYLKKKGLLITVFTNATLINEKAIKFFKRYPPRNIETTVYGVTKKTYEGITRIPDSFGAFTKGLSLLFRNGVKVHLKTMAMHSNFHEFPKIAEFCKTRTRDYFRSDPFLHFRFDGDLKRNEEIESERLSPEEIIALEDMDPERIGALKKECDRLDNPEFYHIDCNHLFHCGIGNISFAVSYDGIFRLCPSLWHRDCVYNLRKGSLKEAWQDFIPKVLDVRSTSKDFLGKCNKCSIINLCMWCPAHAYLETRSLDTPVEYFCKVAHQRAVWLGKT